MQYGMHLPYIQGNPARLWKVMLSCPCIISSRVTRFARHPMRTISPKVLRMAWATVRSTLQCTLQCSSSSRGSTTTAVVRAQSSMYRVLIEIQIAESVISCPRCTGLVLLASENRRCSSPQGSICRIRSFTSGYSMVAGSGVRSL